MLIVVSRVRVLLVLWLREDVFNSTSFFINSDKTLQRFLVKITATSLEKTVARTILSKLVAHTVLKRRVNDLLRSDDSDKLDVTMIQFSWNCLVARQR